MDGAKSSTKKNSFVQSHVYTIRHGQCERRKQLHDLLVFVGSVAASPRSSIAYNHYATLMGGRMIAEAAIDSLRKLVME